MSILLNIRYLLEYVLLRGIIALVRVFPLDTGRELSAKTWRLLAPYGRRHKRALDNLAIAFPEKTLEERQ
ncbi:MAG: lipid A biosynthesis acyltransferase, partial [Alphaproteobacteria bacterium]